MYAQPLNQEPLDVKPSPLTKEEIKAFLDNIEFDTDSCIQKINEKGNVLNIHGKDFHIILEKIAEFYDPKVPVTKYHIMLEVWDLDKEIPTPESLSQHGQYPDYQDIEDTINHERLQECLESCSVSLDDSERFDNLCYRDCLDEKYQEELNQELEREIEKAEGARGLIVDDMLVKIVARPIIKEVDCHLNIPHEHYYRGFHITVETQDLRRAIEIINNYSIFKKIYSKYVSS